MTYDFTSLMDRHGMDAMAVDAPGRLPSGSFIPAAPEEGFDLIPMWVADMNFPTCPTITEAILERTRHPAFGYFSPRAEYYQEIIEWQETRNGVTGLTSDCIGYENSVLGGASSLLRCIAAPGDAVLLHSPTYIGFTGLLEANGYKIVLSPLVRDENGVWRMDYADMEAKIRANRIHAAILCSPHNPTGRVWEQNELEKALDVYRQYGVTVISDEIWSDLILGDHRFIPTQSVSPWARENVAALYAPSKTFNLAGLVGAYHIIYNPVLRDRARAVAAKTHYNEMNVLSMHALIGAYRPEGYVWLDELRQTLTANVDYACDYIAANFDGVEVAKPQGTYMLFLDCTRWCADNGVSIDELLQACWRVGVALQDGRPFHGPCHLRVNLALPLSRVQEAFDRLDRYVFRKNDRGLQHLPHQLGKQLRRVTSSITDTLTGR